MDKIVFLTGTGILLRDVDREKFDQEISEWLNDEDVVDITLMLFSKQATERVIEAIVRNEVH